ncbi:Acyl-CoA N-acyltransferase, partial [Trinorchestia longiramus]
SEVTRRDVLQRLKCFVNTDAPVTALLLHVLSSNSPAIAFYSRRKFMQLAFLPMFYTINDVAQDGYSYVFYLNGGESPGSFFADPFSLTRAGAVTFGTFGSFSYVRARVAGTVSRWMLGDFSLHLNVVGSMLASMIGILDKMVTTLMGADSR